MSYPLYLSICNEAEAQKAAEALDKTVDQILRKHLHVVVNNEVERIKVMDALEGDWVYGKLAQDVRHKLKNEAVARHPLQSSIADLENRIHSLEQLVKTITKNTEGYIMTFQRQIRELQHKEAGK